MTITAMVDYPADETDMEILALLQEEGRRTVADIAQRVSLSATAVKRRIDRLEQAGVITGYSARVDYERLGWHLSAFAELRFAGTTSPEQMNRAASDIPEVSAIYTTAGTSDVTALVRVRDIGHLRAVIHRLRSSTPIISTRTHVILDAQVKDDWAPSRGPLRRLDE